jgi:hypothetical protein
LLKRARELADNSELTASHFKEIREFLKDNGMVGVTDTTAPRVEKARLPFHTGEEPTE